MTRVFVAALNLAWAGIAAVLIASAAFVTIARLLLPEIGSQRDAVRVWISDTVDRPAVVGSIDASWSGWVPRISVEGIAFLDPAGESELVRFERATINIAPLRSILSASLKPRSLILSGVALTLLRDEDGRFSVAGMPAPKSPVIKWLIKQDNFAVTDADLTIIDQRSEQSFALSGLTLTIRDRNDRKVLAGFVDLPDALGGRLAVELSARGDPLGSDWDGAITFRLDGVNSSYLANAFDWLGEPPPNTRINLLGWTQWRDAQLQYLRFGLNASAPDNPATKVLSADGQLERRNDRWYLDVVDIDLPQYARSDGSARLSAAWHSEQRLLRTLALRGHDLPLEPLLTLAAGLAPMTPQWRQNLGPIGAGGVVSKVEAAWRRSPAETPAEFFADIELAHLSSNRHGSLPGIAGLDATIALRSNGGRVRFGDANFKLDHDTRLVETLSVSALDGAVEWYWWDDELEIRAQEVSLEASGTKLIIGGTVNDAFGSAPRADLMVAIPRADARRLNHVIPRNMLPPRGEAWIRHVLEGGEITGGAIALRGPLSKFPFRKAEGVFAVDFDVARGDVLYSPLWPPASAVDGHVSVRGPRVEMKVTNADILGARTVDANVSMADLFTRERFVKIVGNADGPAASAAAIVLASPLKHGKAARIAEFSIDGTLDVRLDMDLALFPNGPREVLGQARFAGNRVVGPNKRVTLDDVTGTVTFTRSDLYGEGLTASFDGTPVGLVVTGGLDDPNYDSEFRLTGTSSAEHLIAQLFEYARPLHRWLETHQSLTSISGELPWKAVLTIPARQLDGPALPHRLRLESSLLGLDIDLPSPLGKRAAKRRSLAVDLALSDGIAAATRIDFGDLLDAEITARRETDGKVSVDKAAILFGTIEPEFSAEPGLSARGYIAKLDLDDWRSVLGRARSGQPQAPADMAIDFDVQIGALGLFNNQFDDIRVRGERQLHAWQIDVASDRARGNLTIPVHDSNAPLDLKFERLHLVKSNDAVDQRDNPVPDPRSLPAVDFAADSLVFGDIALGRAEIRTTPSNEGLTLQHLQFRDVEFSLDAAGDWLIADGLQTSRFHIELASGTLANLLDRFGYNVANIRGGETTMTIDASWPGTPVEFTLARMAGNFELHVNDGRILDIEPGGGRLFGLLSLQSLPRRLSLDFSDLFRKGFAFDSIDGVFELENGNAYTNSLLMSGPSARIDVSGRTGLAEQDYDQSVVVTPALSSSIPVAGALFGPIGIGAGAVYYLSQKMFKSIPHQIDKFLSRNYSVTGPWENPSIERL